MCKCPFVWSLIILSSKSFIPILGLPVDNKLDLRDDGSRGVVGQVDGVEGAEQQRARRTLGGQAGEQQVIFSYFIKNTVA